MKAQLLKESKNENIVAPVSRNFNLNLKMNEIIVATNSSNPNNPNISGVFFNSSKKDIYWL